MAAELPPQAPVIVYPYLWATQHQAGETEGRKARPSCLVLRSYDSNQNIHHLFLLAITSQPPHSDQNEIEIPDTERRRGGLTRYPRAWIIISEYNYDIAEHSYYFEPGTPPLGTFARSLVQLSERKGLISLQPPIQGILRRVPRDNGVKTFTRLY
jgi:hypothetical protein